MRWTRHDRKRYAQTCHLAAALLAVGTITLWSGILAGHVTSGAMLIDGALGVSGVVFFAGWGCLLSPDRRQDER